MQLWRGTLTWNSSSHQVEPQMLYNLFPLFINDTWHKMCLVFPDESPQVSFSVSAERWENADVKINKLCFWGKKSETVVCYSWLLLYLWIKNRNYWSSSWREADFRAYYSLLNDLWWNRRQSALQLNDVYVLWGENCHKLAIIDRDGDTDLGLTNFLSTKNILNSSICWLMRTNLWTGLPLVDHY